MRFNIFKNRSIDAQVGFLMDTYEEALKKRTEKHWRTAIANEIYYACPSVNKGGYPCEPCYEMFEFVLHGHETSHE